MEQEKKRNDVWENDESVHNQQIALVDRTKATSEHINATCSRQRDFTRISGSLETTPA